jgi:hypothetical protein
MVWVNSVCGRIEEQAWCLLNFHHKTECAILSTTGDSENNESLK